METLIDHLPGRKGIVRLHSPAARAPFRPFPRGHLCQRLWVLTLTVQVLESVASVNSDPSPWSQALTGRPRPNLGGSAGPAPSSGAKRSEAQPRQAREGEPRGYRGVPGSLRPPRSARSTSWLRRLTNPSSLTNVCSPKEGESYLDGTSW